MTVIVKPSPAPLVRVIKTESGVVKVIRQVTSTVKLVTQGPQGIQGPAGTTDWNGIINKPSTFTPSAHTHPTTEITGFSAAASAAAPVQSVAGKTGNVTLAKADVGLSNVDNTSDANKPVSTATQTALDLKANASDLTSHTGNTNNPHGVTKAQVGLGNVDNTSDANKPVSTAQVAADTAVANAASADATTKANAAQAHAIQRANHTGTQPISTIDNLQTSLDGKSAVGHGHNIADVSGLQTALDGKQASGSYATLENGLVPSSQLPSYVDDVLEFANLAGFPVSGDSGKIYVALDTTKIYRWSGSAYVEISPSPGSTDAVPEGTTNKYFTTQRASDASPVQSVAGKVGAVTLAKSDVGLGNVDNTTDANKPISSATQTALDLKANASDLTAHTGNTSNPHGVTKSQVGLGNVDNTSDANKPVSTAQQTALDGKANTSHSHAIADVTGLQTALDGKQASLPSGDALQVLRRNTTNTALEFATPSGGADMQEIWMLSGF